MSWAARSFTEGGLDPRTVRIVHRAADAGRMIALAESLTGGALASALIEVPGASACIAGSAVCYTERAKARVLGVDEALLAREGAVIEQVAEQMARGALDLYGADLAVATTGVAGPGPDARGTAAGTVLVGLALRGAEGAEVHRLAIAGDRAQVRADAVQAALALLDEALA